MRSSLNAIAVAAALLSGTRLLGAPAIAAVVIDQNQPLAVGGYTYLEPTGLSAQSFQQSANNIAGAGIFLAGAYGPGSDDITIALWTDLSNSAGTFRTSGTATATSAGTWLDVFWSPVAITPGTTQYLVVSSAGFPTYVYGYAAFTYPAGELYSNDNPQVNFDATFRTYSDTAFSAAVPEPSTC